MKLSELTEQKPKLKLSQVLNSKPEIKKESVGDMLGRNFKKAGEDVYREVVSPVLSGASTAALGIPKAAAEAAGKKEEIFPEQKTLQGKALRLAAEGTGFMVGGGVKIAGNIVSKLIPKAAVESLKKSVVRDALQFGTAGVLQTPEKGITNPVKTIEERAKAGAIGLSGGALPLAGKGIKKGVDALGKGIQKSSVGIKKGVDAIKKSSVDYVTNTVAPNAHAVYQDSIKKFTPQIQNFAKNKLKIPDSAVDTIKKVGFDQSQTIRNAYGDSTDLMYQKIEKGFSQKRQVADKAYQDVMSAVPEGKVINVRPAIEQAGNVLKRLGLVTKNGNLTELGTSEIARDSVYSKLLDFYKSADSISGVVGLRGKELTTGQMIKSMKASKSTMVNKEQFQFLRDKLNALFKGKTSDVNVKSIVNQFYSDGERSGITGLNNARKLQREAFQAEDKFLGPNGKLKVFNENKLDNFHKMTQDEIRQLREIEQTTGVNFVDDLNVLTSAREADKLTNYNMDRFTNDLNKAVDPKWTEYIKKEYHDLLGDKEANKIFDEIKSHRRGLNLKKAGRDAALTGAGAVGLGTAYKVIKNAVGQ